VLLLAALVLTIAAPASAARHRVRWTKVEAPAGDGAKRVERNLKRMLKKATRRAKWGKHKGIKLSARVVQWKWEDRGDVVRLSVTVVARIAGGRKARSHIRVGGRPKERRKLEREALKIVSEGLVTRLSALARK
jgi:hypothetical protein